MSLYAGLVFVSITITQERASFVISRHLLIVINVMISNTGLESRFVNLSNHGILAWSSVHSSVNPVFFLLYSTSHLGRGLPHINILLIGLNLP